MYELFATNQFKRDLKKGQSGQVAGFIIHLAACCRREELASGRVGIFRGVA